MSVPKIGTIDIETAPIEGRTWGLFDQTIGLNQIVQEWAILSFCFIPLRGRAKDVIYVDTSNKEDPRNDYELCAKLWEILHEYDMLITQNGKRFDLKKIRARLILHGFPPPSPVRVIDTLLMARQVAAFTSNKLEWLSEWLTNTKKSAHNQFPGFLLWSECLAGNPRAWAAMKKYNIRDVISTAKVYLRLRPWISGHPQHRCLQRGYYPRLPCMCQQEAGRERLRLHQRQQVPTLPMWWMRCLESFTVHPQLPC